MGDDAYFDKDDDLLSWRGKLPHWHQQGKLQFLTGRLADSMPQSVIAEIRNRKEKFFADHEQPWDDDTLHAYLKLTTNAEERYLHNGVGSCVLRLPAARQAFIETLNYLREEKLRTLALVIMPNHYHLLYMPLGTATSMECTKSINRNTSRNINRAIGRSGSLWQPEPWDRIVRSSAHEDYILNYIRLNPRALHPSEYTLYFNDGNDEPIPPVVG